MGSQWGAIMYILVGGALPASIIGRLFAGGLNFVRFDENLRGEKRGGISPSPKNSFLPPYGVSIGNGAAFTHAD